MEAPSPLQRRAGLGGPPADLSGIRVAATDMDGTFLLPSHEAPPENLAAFRELEARGLHTLFCTGRNRASAQARLPTVDLSARPGVFLNGSIVYGTTGDVIHERTVSSDVIVDIVRFVQGEGGNLSAVFCFGDEHAVPDLDEKWARHLEKDYEDPAPTSLGGYDAVIKKFGGATVEERAEKKTRAQEPHLLHILGSVEGLDATRARIEDLASGRVKFVRALPTCLTLLHPLCSKADGLAAALLEFSCTLAETIAFGDAENDLEMLQAVKLGVAVGNAMQTVKDGVEWHCPANSAQPPGVAQVLQIIVGSSG